MHKRVILLLKGNYKPMLAGLVGVALLVVVFLVVTNRNNNEPTNDSQEQTQAPPKTLEEAASRAMYFNSPDDTYFESLVEFADSTDNMKEKATTYKALGEGYYKVGKVQEALDAYKKSKELFDVSGFTDEQKKNIEDLIVSIENQLNYKHAEDPAIEAQRGTPL